MAAVGRRLDTATIGPQPPHVHVVGHVPLWSVVPHADLVVSHGGSGTIMATLAAGVPCVVLPMGADQPHNAARCVALGVGVALDATGATPVAVARAVRRVLADPSFRAAALALKSEATALPPPMAAVALLEQLANRGILASG